MSRQRRTQSGFRRCSDAAPRWMQSLPSIGQRAFCCSGSKSGSAGGSCGGPLLVGCPGGARPAWGGGSKPAALAAGAAAAEAEAAAMLMAAVLAVAPTRARRAETRQLQLAGPSSRLRLGTVGKRPGRAVVGQGGLCVRRPQPVPRAEPLSRKGLPRGLGAHFSAAPRPAAHRLSRPSHVRTCHPRSRPRRPLSPRRPAGPAARHREGSCGWPGRPAQLLPAAAACCGGTRPEPGPGPCGPGAGFSVQVWPDWTRGGA
jgi:hypothetical protein